MHTYVCVQHKPMCKSRVVRIAVEEKLMKKEEKSTKYRKSDIVSLSVSTATTSAGNHDPSFVSRLDSTRSLKTR